MVVTAAEVQKYDNLILKMGWRCVNDKRLGLQKDDVLQEGRIKVIEALEIFKKRCDELKWDRYEGAEYIFVKNSLTWLFDKRTKRIPPVWFNDEIVGQARSHISKEKNEFKFGLADKVRTTGHTYNYDLLDKSLRYIVENNKRIRDRWKPMMRKGDKDFTLQKLLNVMELKDKILVKNRKRFWAVFLPKISAKDYDIVEDNL